MFYLAENYCSSRSARVFSSPRFLSADSFSMVDGKTFNEKNDNFSNINKLIGDFCLAIRMPRVRFYCFVSRLSRIVKRTEKKVRSFLAVHCAYGIGHTARALQLTEKKSAWIDKNNFIDTTIHKNHFNSHFRPITSIYARNHRIYSSTFHPRIFWIENYALHSNRAQTRRQSGTGLRKLSNCILYNCFHYNSRALGRRSPPTQMYIIVVECVQQFIKLIRLFPCHCFHWSDN